MAKGKPKGKGKKPKKDKINMVPNVLTEVERTFYELHIADLNKKINRLSTLTDSMQLDQEECNDEFKKLDDERLETIQILRNTLKEKNSEIENVQEAITLTQDTTEEDDKKFEEEVQKLDDKYIEVRNELATQNKILEGMHNALEEFSLQQETLQQKYEQQEIYMEEKEIKHKEEMEEIRIKFEIVKQKLKREMESTLLQLSTEFQEKSDAQMPATTHKMVRENVAIYNELDLLMLSEYHLEEQNQILRDQNQAILSEFAYYGPDKRNLIEQTAVQKKVIVELKRKVNRLYGRIDSLFSHKRYDELYTIVRDLTQEEQKYKRISYINSVLKKNLHCLHCQKESLEYLISELSQKNNLLQYLLVESLCGIERAVAPGIDRVSRERLLQGIINTLSDIKLPIKRIKSNDSVTVDYKVEDTPTVKVPILINTSHMTRQNVGLQTGKSLEEIPQYVEKDVSIGSVVSVHEVEVHEDSEIGVSSSVSDMFYKDQESSHGSLEDASSSQIEQSRTSLKFSLMDESESLADDEEEEELVGEDVEEEDIIIKKLSITENIEEEAEDIE